MCLSSPLTAPVARAGNKEHTLVFPQRQSLVFPLVSPMLLSSTWRALMRTCTSHGANVRSSWEARVVAGREGRNEGPQAPAAPVPFSFGREGRWVLLVDHHPCSLLSATPGTGLRLLRDVTFLRWTWHWRPTSKKGRCFFTKRVVWRHLQMPPLHPSPQAP